MRSTACESNVSQVNRLLKQKSLGRRRKPTHTTSEGNASVSTTDGPPGGPEPFPRRDATLTQDAAEDDFRAEENEGRTVSEISRVITCGNVAGRIRDTARRRVQQPVRRRFGQHSHICRPPWSRSVADLSVY
nr:hypothetical protein Iba_chr10eCG9950 [Ipomoea batatas]